MHCVSCSKLILYVCVDAVWLFQLLAQLWTSRDSRQPHHWHHLHSAQRTHQDRLRYVWWLLRQPCVNGDWLCQWERAIFDPPQNPPPLTDHRKIWFRWLHRQPLQPCQIWCKSVHDCFWANGWNIMEIFFHLYIFLWTHLQVRPVDGFLCLMAQTTRTHVRVCVLGVSLILPPMLGVKSHENPISIILDLGSTAQENSIAFFLFWMCLLSLAGICS